MNEGQVSVEGETHTLAKPFMVIATENPVEYQGTYPLPEAQLDRFAMQLEIGYPSEEDELEILYSRQDNDPLDLLEPVLDCDQICEIQQQVKQVKVEKSIAHYIVKIIRATRDDMNVKLGASPRAFLSLTRCAQAKAFYEGRDFVVPDDVKQLASPVLSHRIILENKIKYAGAKKQDIFISILNKVEIPV
jgi:MoxR-like ATPase